MNSAVGPIFNEKIDKKMKFVGPWKTGQKLRLLFMYRTWTAPPVGGKGVKKKKKKKRKTQKLKTQ